MFFKKNWKNRLVEHPGRRTITDVSTGSSTTVDVSRSEGEIYNKGDAFSAANMNDLEYRVSELPSTTTFNSDKSITQEFDDGAVVTTRFLPDRSIIEIGVNQSLGLAKVKKTMFLPTGEIAEEVEYGTIDMLEEVFP